MEKMVFNKTEKIELSPEIKDLLDRFKFALPGPGYAYGMEGKANSRISERIMNQEYDVIIAEDASGRIPGLLIYEAMKTLYATKNNEQNLKLFFVAGSKNVDNKKEKKDKISKHINEVISKSHTSDKKFLVVTDVIMEGESLKPLAASLKELNIEYDILTLGVGRTLRSHGGHIYDLNQELGSVSDARVGIPEIFDRRDLSGVIKDPNEILSSRIPNNDMDKLGKVRNEIKVAAEELYEKISKFKKTD